MSTMVTIDNRTRRIYNLPRITPPDGADIPEDEEPFGGRDTVIEPNKTLRVPAWYLRALRESKRTEGPKKGQLRFKGWAVRLGEDGVIRPSRRDMMLMPPEQRARDANARAREAAAEARTYEAKASKVDAIEARLAAAEARAEAAEKKAAEAMSALEKATKTDGDDGKKSSSKSGSKGGAKS